MHKHQSKLGGLCNDMAPLNPHLDVGQTSSQVAVPADATVRQHFPESDLFGSCDCDRQEIGGVARTNCVYTASSSLIDSSLAEPIADWLCWQASSQQQQHRLLWRFSSADGQQGCSGRQCSVLVADSLCWQRYFYMQWDFTCIRLTWCFGLVVIS